jgi:Cu-Zn family superoxide dismutase
MARRRLSGSDRQAGFDEVDGMPRAAPMVLGMPEDGMTRWITGLTLACALMAGLAEAQPKASADIKNAAGETVGEAVLEQRDDGVQITVTLTGLSPGPHAFHIHETGRCDPPFESAGGHFNPTGKQHGKDNPQGPHLGDLPNLDVPQSGRVKAQVTVKDVTLAGGRHALLDADGAAVVVHEGADDYKSDTAGNAGERLACGVIRR